MKLTNVRTALTNPALAAEYVQWLLQNRFGNGDPSKAIGGLIRVGGFRSFSEYYSVDKFITPHDLGFFKSLRLGPGVIIDIGANVGVVSSLLAKLMPERHGFAVEPNPWVCQQLSHNLRRNGASNFEILPLALANHVGEVNFRTTPTATATARIANDGDQDSSVVPCETLDHLAARLDIDRIAFLKVDVEGFEASVFMGAQGLLDAKRIEQIYFEVCPELTETAGFDPQDAAQLLQNAGYQLFQLAEGGALRAVQPLDAQTKAYDNWVAIADA
jgi:FkbM family methyltransferase